MRLRAAISMAAVDERRPVIVIHRPPDHFLRVAQSITVAK